MVLIRLSNFEQLAAINVLSDPGAAGGKLQITNGVQIVLNWSLPGGKTGHNVWYGRSSGVPAPTVAQCDQIMNALISGTPATNYFATITTGASLSSVTIRSVHIVDQVLFTSTVAAKAGTEVSSPLPNEVGIVVTHRTNVAGPGGRGRTFLVGFTSSSSASAQTIAGATITAINNWAATWAGAVSAAGYTFGLGLPARLEYPSHGGGTHPARASRVEPIVSSTARNNTWDSQRRRGLK